MLKISENMNIELQKFNTWSKSILNLSGPIIEPVSVGRMANFGEIQVQFLHPYQSLGGNSGRKDKIFPKKIAKSILTV